MGLHEQAQCGFHGRFLGGSSTASHGFAHEPVVNVNIRTHTSPMCKDSRFMCMNH